MFFVKDLRKDILLEPKHLGAQLKDRVKQRVLDEMDGQCLGKYGYVVNILDIKDENISPGPIDMDTGSVRVEVWYTALLLRPFKNEVLDAVVVSANEVMMSDIQRRGPSIMLH